MRIIFRYLAMQDIVDFALATLRDRSSVGWLDSRRSRSGAGNGGLDWRRCGDACAL
jgi:hypothetical protein